MEITAIEAHPLTEDLWNPWFILTVETDAGIRGVGEVGGLWGHTDLRAKHQHVSKFEEWFRGEDPRRIERLRAASQETPWGLSRLNQEVFSGLEIACWDIKGKHHGVPVHELLGGKVRDRLRAYANGWYDSLETPEEWAEGARGVVDRGYDAMKFDPIERSIREIRNPHLELALDRIEAIREAVGPEPDLFIEGHARLTPGEAIKFGKRMEKYNPGWYEAPVQLHQGPEAFREVREALSIPVADDLAGVHHKFSALEFLSERAVDVIQPDPGSIGGIREIQYIAQMADAASIFTAPHAAAGPVNTCASVHVDAVIPNFKIQEGFNEFTRPDWVEDVFDDPISIREGRIEVPDRPGLGVGFDEQEAAKHDCNPMPDHNFLAKNFKETYRSKDFSGES